VFDCCKKGVQVYRKEIEKQCHQTFQKERGFSIMAKKSKKAISKKSKKAVSKGSKLSCKECGLQVMVVDDCGCDPCDLVCCGEPMVVCS
jgi:hypothetical protein